MSNKNDIKHQINQLRKILDRLMTDEDNTDSEKLLELSRKLDELINKYYHSQDSCAKN